MVRLNKHINITKEKLASRRKEISSLKRSLRIKDLFINSLPAGIVLLQQGKIIEINNTLLDLLGYETDEVVGRDYTDFIHPAQKNMSRDYMTPGIQENIA